MKRVVMYKNEKGEWVRDDVKCGFCDKSLPQLETDFRIILPRKADSGCSHPIWADYHIKKFEFCNFGCLKNFMDIISSKFKGKVGDE